MATADSSAHQSGSMAVGAALQRSLPLGLAGLQAGKNEYQHEQIKHVAAVVLEKSLRQAKATVEHWQG